jgi:hypothetical protein
MVDVRMQVYIQPLGHAFGQGVQTAAVSPLGVGILERIALLDVPLGIEDPDRLADIDEIVEIKALGDQCGTGRRAAFDILRSMIIDKASPFAGSCASAYALTLLKERYCMACILEYMCGSQSRASRAYDGYSDH